MEYSKLGLQHFTPEYTDYVYDLPQPVKDELIPNQDILYKGIDPRPAPASTTRCTSSRSAAGTPTWG